MKENIVESQEDAKIDLFIEKMRKILTDAALSLENEDSKANMLNLLKDV
jgi:hypothetical protein